MSASEALTGARLAVACAYGAGTGIALYAVMRGGRRLTRRLAPHAGRVQPAAGAVMVVVALLMLGGSDTRFQTAIAGDLPALLVNPTRSLEESAAARERIAALQPQDVRRSRLPVYAAAPDFAGTQRWFNTPGGRPAWHPRRGPRPHLRAVLPRRSRRDPRR